MIVSFYATLIGVGGPDWGEFGKGITGFALPAGSLTTALAFISTNASVTTGIYNSYLGQEKKWKKEDLFNGVMFTDAVVHILSVVMISGSIILVGAIVLNPTGQTIKAPAQLYYFTVKLKLKRQNNIARQYEVDYKICQRLSKICVQQPFLRQSITNKEQNQNRDLSVEQVPNCFHFYTPPFRFPV